MRLEFDIEGGNFSTAGKASSDVKKTLKQLNISPALIRRISVALYESEVNVVAHAHQGKMIVDIVPTHIEVLIEDEGPGIEDVEKAMQEGYSTASSKVREMGFGAGMGLPNIKKNCDEMELSSVPNEGTKLRIKINF